MGMEADDDGDDDGGIPLCGISGQEEGWQGVELGVEPSGTNMHQDPISVSFPSFSLTAQS